MLIRRRSLYHPVRMAVSGFVVWRLVVFRLWWRNRLVRILRRSILARGMVDKSVRLYRRVVVRRHVVMSATHVGLIQLQMGRVSRHVILIVSTAQIHSVTQQNHLLISKEVLSCTLQNKKYLPVFSVIRLGFNVRLTRSHLFTRRPTIPIVLFPLLRRHSNHTQLLRNRSLFFHLTRIPHVRVTTAFVAANRTV